MAAGRNTFIDSMLNVLNMKNVFEQTRYPETTLDELKSLAPDLILLSSEPYPFKEKHMVEIQRAIPNARIELVDGEMFSWYFRQLLTGI
jgi:ABC-type Fe3+-hydroxamate transport system substrate-binding protein